MKDAWFPLIKWKSKINITYDSTTHEWRTFQIGIGTSSMCAFDLFKDFGLKKIDDDSFLNLAGYVSYWHIKSFSIEILRFDYFDPITEIARFTTFKRFTKQKSTLHNQAMSDAKKCKSMEISRGNFAISLILIGVSWFLNDYMEDDMAIVFDIKCLQYVSILARRRNTMYLSEKSPIYEA